MPTSSKSWLAMLVVALVALVALLAPAIARAQQPSGPSLGDELSGTAKAEYAAGRVLFTDGNHAGALVKFQSALDESKDARLLWNIAACHRALRHYAETIRYLDRFKNEAKAAPDSQRVEADQTIAALRPYVAAVTVHSNESGAQVLLDDRPIGTTPVEKHLVDLGEHRLVVKKAGFTDDARPLTIGTADMILDVRLEPVRDEGRISVRAGSGDIIAIDGKDVGVSEYAGTLAAGMHLLRVSANGKKPYEARVIVEMGQLRTVDVVLEKDDRSILPLWAWIGIGAVTAAGLTVGGLLLFQGDDATAEGRIERGTIPPGVVQLPSRSPFTF